MNELRELLLNGWMIYPQSGKFILEKKAVPENMLTIPPQEFNDYEAALSSGYNDFLNSFQIKWNVIVRYNRGLGAEYRNIPTIVAATKDKAKIIAECLIPGLFSPDEEIQEIKVYPKNND